MYILKLFEGHTVLLSVLIGILIINFGCIIYLVLKERKADQEEIEEIENDLASVSSEPEVIEILDNEEEKIDKEVEKNKTEIEEMLIKMQKDLDAKPQDVVTNFENEQEEKSIISYQELVNSVKEKNEVNQAKVHIATFEDDIGPKEEKKESKENPYIKKFKNTEFISPIFGKQDDKIVYPTVPKEEVKQQRSGVDNVLDELDFSSNETINMEKTIDVSALKNEMNKNTEFLKALKEFRKNLD